MARKLRISAFLLLVLAVLGVIFHERLLTAIGSYLVRAEQPTHAEIAVVLAGDYWGDRILKAAELVKAGYVPRALISGPDGHYGFNECDLAIPFAVKSGYPEMYFEHFENTALSTEQEARQVSDELRRKGARTVLIVTSDFHTRRAGRMYRAAAPEIDFHVVAARHKYFSASAWWRDREGRKVLFSEWARTVASWFGI